MARRGRLGAFAQHAAHDPRETTAAARRAFLDNFVALVDPDRTLPEEERQRRAKAARSAHFSRLAIAGSRKRRERARAKGAQNGA